MTRQESFSSMLELGRKYLHDYVQMYPRERAFFMFFPFGAAYMGIHDGDGRVADYRPESIARRVEQLGQWDAILVEADQLAVTGNDRIDLDILRWMRGAEYFALTELQPFRYSPTHYGDTVDLSGYVRRNYAPLNVRMRGALGQLRAIPAALDVARNNLDRRLPRVNLDVGINSFGGYLRFIRTTLLETARGTNDSVLISEIEAAIETAAAAIERFIADLEARRTEATDEFALGSERFLGLLRNLELVDLPLDEIRRAAQDDLEQNKHQLEDVCRQIDPDVGVVEVLDRIQVNHPPADGLIAAAASMLDDLRTFTLERGLVSIPSTVDPIVAETPAYRRASTASMDSPGAYEDEASGAHFFVTSPEPDWTDKQVEQWLRQFFYASVANTAAHEAYPGHYVQSQHKRLAPTDVQKAFDAFTNWEAWAHYCEQMLLDEGFADGDLEQRVAQLIFALLRNARFVVAIGMHCDGMTVDQATQVIMDATYMDELPARREAERGTYDAGYGNYNLGKLMLLKLRRDVEAERGDQFSLGEFHDEFLSHGAPPLPIVRRRMLQHDDGRLL